MKVTIETTKEDYLTKLFINECKPALNRHSGGTSKAEVPGSFEITENGEHTFTPDNGEAFSLVKVLVDVPTSSGSNIQAGTDVSTSFGVNCGDKWYCPVYGENAISFNMMAQDTTGQFTAFGNCAAIPGKKYIAVFKPMNPDNLWESFVFGQSDYMTLAVVANDESIDQYVTKVGEDTFEFTVPPNCSLVFLNGYIQYGCRVYEIE